MAERRSHEAGAALLRQCVFSASLRERKDVDERTRSRARAEDLRAGVEDEHEHDEDQKDDPDDHACAKAAIRVGSTRVDVHLAHELCDLLSLSRRTHSQSACRFSWLAHMLGVRGTWSSSKSLDNSLYRRGLARLRA